MSFKSELMKIAEDYITAKGWSAAVNDEEYFIETELELDGDSGTASFWLISTDDGLVSYALISERVPTEKYGITAEYLHRANYGLLNGCFELDYSEGYVQFRTFCCCPNEEIPSFDDIEVLFSIPLAVLNRYKRGLHQIISGEETDAASLIERIEIEK